MTNPENTVFSIKRFMGRKFDEVNEEMTIVPYKVVKGPNDDVRVEAGGKEYAPPEISAMILQKLKTDAEAYLGETVTDAVITVPAYFNNAQREATKDAGKIAGLNVLRIINEPTAAALAYGLDKEGADQTILVFDLGGGTFDVSVLELGDGVFEVKSTNGDNHLGGDNFDKAVVDWMVAEFKKDQGIDLSIDPMALQRLYEAAEKAKIELSSTMTTQINLPFITATQDGPKHLDLQLTRAKLEELAHELLERTVGPTKQALTDAGLDASKIDHVVLVGGMTRMPAVQAKVKELIGKDPHKGVNPDEVVAVGAADPGRRAEGRGQGRAAPRRDAAVARDRDQGRRHDEADRAQHDDPDAQVGGLLDRRGQPAVGARARAAGRVGDGDVQQDARQVRARRHPAGAARHAADRGVVRHRRERDHQRLGQGHRDRQRAADPHRRRLGPEAGRGRPHDQGGRGAQRRGARSCASVVDARNNAESLAYQIEKSLKEHREKLDESLASTVEGRIMELRGVLESGDVAEINAKTDALQEAWTQAASALYAQASSEQAAAPNGDDSPQSPTTRSSRTPSTRWSTTSERGRAHRRRSSSRRSADGRSARRGRRRSATSTSTRCSG